MRSISKDTLIEMLSFVIERGKLTIKRSEEITSYHDYLLSPQNMDIFDATCMRLQTIGETMRKIENLTDGNLLIFYTDIPWKKVFGLRNILSHEYAAIDAEVIFNIVKKSLPPLLASVACIIANLQAGEHNDLFQ